MSRGGAQFKRALIFVHRWMGVLFCLLFLSWFASGIVMMYWQYPQVSPDDRLSRAPALDASRITLSPQQAYMRLGNGGEPSEARLITFDGRPAYRFGFGDSSAIVYADDGQMPDEFPAEMTLRIASAWSGQSPGGAKEADITEEDQWTVSEEFSDLRPLRKYSWADGRQVYVSAVTGDVVQYTTRGSRLAAWFGAIPHWLYFTQLRKHSQQWGRVVIWASGLGTATAILGITVGLWIYSPAKSYRSGGAPASFPYHGQKRWHAILGLLFGVFACTWAFSGMLSMDPFPRLQSGSSSGAGARIAAALRQAPPLGAFSAKPPQQALSQAQASYGTGYGTGVKELEMTSFAGEPAYLASLAPNGTRVIPVHGQPAAEFDRAQIISVARQAARPFTVTQARMVTQYEAYYLDRENQLPLPAIFVQLDDPGRSMYYIDPKTARIVQGYNSHSRWNRWLYHGLHSLNLPWLYKYRPAWDIVVILLLLGGGSLSVTALLLAWNVLWRKLAPWAAQADASSAMKG